MFVRRATPALTALAVLAALLSGCASVPSDTTNAGVGVETAIPAHSTPKTGRDKPNKPAASKAPRGKAGTALAALATLPVKGRAPMTGYDRNQFGSAWSDAAGTFDWSRNGCDTRNDTLNRDLTTKTTKPGTGGCKVYTGVLAYDPYSGDTNTRFDSQDNNYDTDLDAEHIVALGNAWATGAQQWDADKRAAFANDPINLMMVDPSLNRQKSDADFATWLPPNKTFRCSYAARQIRVKSTYGLWVTSAEKTAFERVLTGCPNEPVNQPAPQTWAHTKGLTTTPSKPSKPTKAPKTLTHTPTKPAKGDKGSKGDREVTYANCTEVRAAGKDPIRKGQPGYSTKLDRDRDGIACDT